MRLCWGAALVVLLHPAANGAATSPPSPPPPGRLRLPTLGWNSWYGLGKAAGWPSTREDVILETAAALVSTGLRDAGYTTLVIDDSWEATRRRPPPNAGLEPNPAKFPHGMKYVANRLKSMSLTLGLYTVPGNFTCSGEGGGGELGSYGHVQADIDLWVGEWGVRYIKDCVCNTTSELRSHAYNDMRSAIERHPDAEVVYECANFMDRPWAGSEAADHVCNIWSVSDDVPDDFDSWTAGVDRAVTNDVNRYAGPDLPASSSAPASRGGGWSSFDYLQVGGKQSLTEYRAQMSMFAMLAAPIFIGSDLRTIAADDLAIYLAPEVLAVHQDSMGRPGHRVSQDTSAGSEFWVRPLRDAGVCAFLLLNRARATQRLTLNFAAVAAPLSSTCFSRTRPNAPPSVRLRDAWGRKDLGVWNTSYAVDLEAHSAVLVVAQPHPAATNTVGPSGHTTP